MSPEIADLFRQVTDQVITVDRNQTLTHANEPAAGLTYKTPDAITGRDSHEVSSSAPGPQSSETELSERPSGRAIRVMIVDDHEILREGLTNLLESSGLFEVVAAVEDGAAAVESARKSRPNVILMDVTMPTMNGIEATRRIKAEMPECRIIGLSMHEGEKVEQAMRDAGASAYVSKDAPWDKLNSVIQGVVTG